jgi:cathepsin A (carboxypeptidase C)
MAGAFVLACLALAAMIALMTGSGSSIQTVTRESVSGTDKSLYAQQRAMYDAALSETTQLMQTDEVVPESEESSASGDWSAERARVWSEDKAMLSQTDKAMHAALESQLEAKDSAQWERYLRHKNLRPPTAKGHTWRSKENSPEVSGVLLETSSDDSNKLCDKNVAQHHGYFKLSGGKDKEYFYWLFEAKENPETAPLVMWLTGGPGCSSELALFTENGPCSVNDDGESTKPNPFSWNSKANLVFLDQPAGTGYSYGGASSDTDSDEATIGEDLYHFMQELVKTYPQYHKAPFYIFGESYAGHFVPAAGHHIMDGNAKKDGEYIALKGIGVGNGLTNPEIQYPYYPQMAFHSDTTPKIIQEEDYQNMLKAIPSCVAKIKDCQTNDPSCSEAFQQCNFDMINPVQDTGVNVYNLNEQCTLPPLCGDYSHVKAYLNNPRVMQTLGVRKTWKTCNFGINSMFHTDWMHNQDVHIPPMLENGMRALIYAGDVDFICNWMGNKAWTLNLDWSGKDAFNKAKDLAWTVNGKTVGTERNSGPFTFLRLHGAGHMVPQDQPANAYLMVNAFISNQLLVSVAPTSQTDQAH